MKREMETDKQTIEGGRAKVMKKNHLIVLKDYKITKIYAKS